MNKFCLRIFIVTIFTLLLPCISSATDTIHTIEIKGNERISNSTVNAYLKFHTGDKYSHRKVDESIKSLFATGFFSDIKIHQEGTKVIVALNENPLINQIAFEGNKRIKDADLLKELNMTERSVYSASKLQNDVQRIISLYQKKGRYSVKVEPKLIKLDQNRINLVYEIAEGNKAKIKKILFVGNKEFSSDKLSRTIMSREESWYRFFSTVDVYDPDKLLFDQELLRRFYMREGFADFQISSANAELSPTKDSFLITFVVHEGDMYKFGDIAIKSEIAEIDTKDLYSLLALKSKTTFNEEQLEETVDKLTDHLGKLGYAFVDIDYSIEKDRTNKIANIHFVINQSHKIYINRINIKNNTKTLEKVIRREFKIAEGDPYNAHKISRSNQRIRNLGYFSSVEFKNVKTDNHDKVDIEATVEETSTGSVNFAAGYNTTDGPMGSVSIAEANFLGKGQYVEMKFVKAQKSNDISFSFTEPYFMDKPLSVGFDVFTNSKDRLRESSYKSKSTGFVLRLGYDITEHLYHGIRYSAKQEDISEVSAKASRYIKDQEGKNSVSLVGHTLTYDALDDRLDPHKGYIIRLSQDLAGIGGQTHYLENKIVTGVYFPLYKNSVILGLTGKAGHITGWNGEKVRVNDRLFLGGDDIRGFDSAGIGPRDKKQGDALGGDAYYLGSAEVTFPVGLPNELGVRGAVFTDAASLFGTNMRNVNKADVYDSHSLRASYGAGILWNSAIGNIRIDFGFPIRKEHYDKKQTVRFSFGTKF